MGIKEPKNNDEITRKGNTFNLPGKLPLIQDNGKLPSFILPPGGGGATLADGDYGDIVVSDDGTKMDLDINGSSAKTTPVDGDMFAIMDSETAGKDLKKFSWSNMKSKLKAYFDTVYTLTLLGGVPTSRTVNSKALSSNISLTASDVGAEASFSKNTAFNKNFGTNEGEVCQGNDSRLSDARTPSAHDIDGAAHNGLSGATENNFAGFSATGKIKDTGSKAGDFATSGHDHSGVYAPAANGVTNGDSHNHDGGDGAQIAYSGLSGIPSTFAPASHNNTAHSETYITSAGVTKAAVGLSNVTNDAQVKKITSSTDNQIMRWDGTGGDTPQGSNVTVDDNGSVNIPSGQSYKINNVALTYSDVGASASGHNHSDTYEAKNSNIQTHISTTSGNPHSVTKTDVGLGNVTNDAQLKAASNLSDVAAQQTALNNITAVSGATNEHVLTKDTGTGNATWKAAAGGASLTATQQAGINLSLSSL